MPARLWICYIALLFVSTGCRDQDPPEAFNADLNLSGNPDARLMPSAVGYHSAHNPGIRQGNTRATIVKLADFDPAAPMPDLSGGGAAGTTPQVQPAQGLAGALGSVGSAFLGGLARGASGQSGGGTAGGPAGTSAGGSATGTGTGGAPPAGTLSQSDSEALYTLVERYGAARKSRAFIDLPDLAVSTQRDTALDYYDKLAELNAVFTNMITVFDSTEAGIKTEFEGLVAKGLVAYELTNPAGQGADAATATLMPVGGGAPLNATFQRESGYWRIQDPFVPSAQQWAKVAADLDSAIQALNEMDSDLLAGQKVEPARAREAFTRAVTLLGGGA